MIRRPCSKCGTVDIPKYFNDGTLHTFCIMCRRDYATEWKAKWMSVKANRDHRNAVNRAWVENNRKKINAYRRKWYAKRKRIVEEYEQSNDARP